MSVCVSFVQGSSFQWKVEDALTIDSLESDDFFLCGCRWRLRLNLDVLDFMSIYLEKLNSEKLNDTYLIHAFILDDIEETASTHFYLLDDSDFVTEQIWWIHTDVFQKRRDTYLTDGTLTFVVDFTPANALGADAKREKASDKSIQTSINGGALAELEKFSSDVHNLMDDGVQSDVKLKCGERLFPAHKAILSARSEVFSAMFRSDMAENCTGVIQISVLDASALDQFLHYIYSGNLPDLSVDTAPELYAASDKYSVESLKNACVKFMEENLTKKNANKILLLAETHGDKYLKDAVVSFVRLITELESFFNVPCVFPVEYSELAE